MGCVRPTERGALVIKKNTFHNHNDGCTDIMKLLFPIVEKFIRSNENKDIIETIMKSLLIVSTHINWTYRQKFILPSILSLISNDKYKYIDVILLIELCSICERNIFLFFFNPIHQIYFKEK
ncbi:hypothetical protein PFDG_05002 [Plasmodium falciparum Dd2]|uniref:Uncharacterized protein n=1 Tax=Plasmodium falciparum (isolate Dd2) TaxID=57267 RepID=A0A0L7M9H7_PLAF4|nr:hypothetical protein PFDG_05002 [Plasmodium falciparum Dd2]